MRNHNYIVKMCVTSLHADAINNIVTAKYQGIHPELGHVFKVGRYHSYTMAEILEANTDTKYQQYAVIT